MALKFVYGNPGSGKSRYIYETAIRLAMEDPAGRIFVLVPEQFTLHTQRELARRAKHGVLMNIDVLSFARLSYRVFEELGWHRPVMEETGKSLVLRKIAGECAPDLMILRQNIKKKGFIADLKSMLSEMMQYDISSERLGEFLTDAEAFVDSSLCAKLSDTSLIYSRFEEYLSEHYMVNEKIPEALIEIANESKLLLNATLLLDGFNGFTPLQYKLLEHLMTYVSDIYVSVTIDVRAILQYPHASSDAVSGSAMPTSGIEDLFYTSIKMRDTLQSAAMRSRFRISDPVYLDILKTSRHGSNPVLSHLERTLYRVSSPPYKGECHDALTIHSCASAEEELEWAISAISRKLREDEIYRYSDFALVCSSMDLYEKYASHIFEKYQIPYFIDFKYNVLSNPCVELLRSAIDIAETDYSYESVFRYLKTGLAGLTLSETDILENYVIGRGIRGEKKWGRKFVTSKAQGERNAEDGEKSVERFLFLNDLRARVYEQIQVFKTSICEGNPDVRRRCAAVHDLFLRLSIEEKLKKCADRFSDDGDEMHASEYRQIYKHVIDLLDKTVDLLGDEHISLPEFRDVLEAGLMELKMGSIPPARDCVILGDIERSRIEGVRELFLLGVNDGLIPREGADRGILSQYDREKLKQLDLTLSPARREEIFFERFYLYLTMCKPSDALHLTFSRMEMENKSAHPSYLIFMLQKIFPKLSLECGENEGGIGISAAPALPDAYVQGLARAASGIVDPEWIAMHRCLMEDARYESSVKYICSAAFARYSGEKLSQKVADLLYEHKRSAYVTRLERFAACPYSQFLTYGLDILKREEMGFDSQFLGLMYHDILRRYSRGISEYGGWLRIGDYESEKLIDHSMEESLLALPCDYLNETARGAYIVRRIRGVIGESIWAIREQLSRGDFLPVSYEEKFSLIYPGAGGECSASRADRFRLTGVIDRVDLYRKYNKIYIKITDYKSSRKKISLEDFYYGVQLQLPVYMMAAMRRQQNLHPLCSVRPGAIFYFCADEPMVDDLSDAPAGEDASDKKNAILRRMRPEGLIALDSDSYNHMDRNISGKSDVIPLSINKDGSVSARSSKGASAKEFDLLMAFTEKKSSECIGRILGGEIDILPERTRNRRACDNCAYKSICGFDARIEGFRYQIRENLTDADVYEHIRSEINS